MGEVASSMFFRWMYICCEEVWGGPSFPVVYIKGVGSLYMLVFIRLKPFNSELTIRPPEGSELNVSRNKLFPHKFSIFSGHFHEIFEHKPFELCFIIVYLRWLSHRRSSKPGIWYFLRWGKKLCLYTQRATMSSGYLYNNFLSPLYLLAEKIRSF